MSIRKAAAVSFVLVVLCRFTYAELVNAVPCNDGIPDNAENITVDISGCGNPNNCSLVRGTTHYLTTVFVPTRATNGLKMKIWGVINSLRVPHERTKDVCAEVQSEDGVSCTERQGLRQGVKHTHVKDFYVRRIYPTRSVTVRVLYFAGRRDKVLCFEIPVHIVDSN